MSSKKTAFKTGDYVVYPTHGVGLITGEETQTIGGTEISVYVISFEKEKMILRVPVSRAKAAGLRSLSNGEAIDEAFVVLKGKPRIARGMWSKRAQEYESKINSGNLTQVAEVVRDLHRNVDHPDRSYSERMIYESALGRLAGELAAAKKLGHDGAIEEVVGALDSRKKPIAEAA